MERLINILRNLQGVITKGLTNFKKCSKDRLTVEYVETRHDVLEKDWSLFNDAKVKLYEDFDLVNVEQKLDEIYDATEEIYINYKSLLKATLNKIQIVDKSMPSDSNSAFNKSDKFMVKLPKIAIPTFSGKYEEWATFQDLFTSLVHKNNSLDNVQKLHYLKGHLSGEAEQMIRQTPITDANYIQCWTKLQKRYSNKRYLTNCILKRLFGQKRMNAESSSSLKELIDTTCDCLNALTNLNVDVTTWDVIILHVVAFKLDDETRKHWELHVCTNESHDELPTFEQFRVFIENRFRALECLEPKRLTTHYTHTPRAMMATSSAVLQCEYCSDPHKLCFCKKFARQNIENRREFVRKNRICFNCLGGNHTVYNCSKQTACRICHKRHHSLLHLNRESDDNHDEATSTELTGDSVRPTIDNARVVSCLSTGNIVKPRQVLLATALIKAEAKTGEFLTLRTLLDQGSQACFVTEATVRLLKLKKNPVHGLISGVGDGSSIRAKFMVHLNVKSCVNPEFNLQINAYVLSKITPYLPERSINTELDWLSVTGLKLADPAFKTPNKIDILLGADVYSHLIKPGLLKSPTGALIAQNTGLGWVVSGSVSTENQNNDKSMRSKLNVMHAHVREDEILRQFWEIEEQTAKKILTPEEEKCEELYSKTTKRDTDGRYVVRLPFRDENPLCKAGNSRIIAEKRFRALEKRLEKDLDLKKGYTQVIKEYLDLGHMRPVGKNDQNKEIAVYLPHHAVVREDKTTTKIRVVFNASEKNNKGISLNDTLMVGPTLQPDLRHIVLRWRVHPIALVADIIKMYRQVKVHNEDAIFQRILWRDSPEGDIEDYELTTVTFGTASAPYQAIRTLNQIVYDEGERYPLAKERVLDSFYVDDLLISVEDIETGFNFYKQVTELLSKGKFSLQKWNSNSQEILNRINFIEMVNNAEKPDEPVVNNKDITTKTKVDYKRQLNHSTMKYNERQETVYKNEKEIALKMNNIIKILGLTWNCNEDTFQYIVTLPTSTNSALTKRSIISDIARLFDPLGWLAPSVILAKVFIQKLWLAGVGWDDRLSTELIREWRTYRGELSLLNSIRIPRWMGTRSSNVMELHGFSDASKTAYSAVIYLRAIDSEGKVNVSLLAAKTRVAPVKQISIPRLELCGAVLLSRLLVEITEVLNVPASNVFAWSDSTVVLAWLGCHPSRWKTFVANRTSEILTNTNSSQWFHVSTKENPADCASRGVMPSLLLDNELWFSGPSFLKQTTITYTGPNNYHSDLEQSTKAHVAVMPECSIFERYSTLTKLLRVVAYCRRFLKQNSVYRRQYLQKIELDASLECCIRKSQREQFAAEYNQLETKGYLQLKSSILKSLSPYLDDKGIMRVIGRLDKAPICEQMKRPIVLPHSGHLTRLIITDAHMKTMHGGPQLMMNFLRSVYWIVGVKNLVKKHVHRCVICARQRANTKNQLMGSLPSVRCTPARPFLHCGVDYAGPINVRTTKGRGHRSYKGYICLFVCMVTRALHLELVSDMSTQAFMAAFRRFVSRRGPCAKMFSDNGTTFLGASRELQELAAIQSSIAEHLEAQGTEWHFIPPHSPNFGGLWEAGVKSTKYHLRRVIGNTTLTFEEMTTLLSQIEACLNSRPISVIAVTDPGEPLPLTPGHFLIGEPLVSVPDNQYENSNLTNLSRWQAVQRMVQSFWGRWSREYLSNLMNRYKWSSHVPEPEIGDIVLIKEDDLPPSRWLLGRVQKKHPGDDGITRVVTLKTKSSVMKRPTSKLCILPVAK